MAKIQQLVVDLLESEELEQEQEQEQHVKDETEHGEHAEEKQKEKEGNHLKNMEFKDLTKISSPSISKIVTTTTTTSRCVASAPAPVEDHLLAKVQTTQDVVPVAYAERNTGIQEEHLVVEEDDDDDDQWSSSCSSASTVSLRPSGMPLLGAIAVSGSRTRLRSISSDDSEFTLSDTSADDADDDHVRMVDPSPPHDGTSHAPVVPPVEAIPVETDVATELEAANRDRDALRQQLRQIKRGTY